MKVGRSKFAIAVSILLVPFHGAHADPLCGILLSSPHEINAHGESELDETDYFIAYLNDLFDGKIITEDQLSHFVLGLRGGDILNPLQGEGGSASEIQRDGIQNYIERSVLGRTVLDKNRLLNWAEQRLAERNQAREKRHLIHEITRSPFQKIAFHPVRVGSFQMGEKGEVSVRLTYPIEVMSTPATQKHWVEIMGENPSDFAEGEHSVLVDLDGRSIWMQPDNPVETINWWSILVFANRLSEKHGLKPAYDLSELKWKPDTRAGNGTLEALDGEVKINVRGEAHYLDEEDIYYQADGYRLPTDAEQEYLLRAGGRARGKYHFGNNKDKLKDYAWYEKNSGEKTHPVGVLKPLILDGRAFYDLHGNVEEWSWDEYGVKKSGRNPVRSGPHSAHIVRSGSWDVDAFMAQSHVSYSVSPDEQSNCRGFRLVRTIGSQ